MKRYSNTLYQKNYEEEEDQFERVTNNDFTKEIQRKLNIVDREESNSSLSSISG